MEQRLKDKVRTITTWLGQIIKENEGEALYKKVEQVRLLCKDLRQKEVVGKTGQLKKILLRMDVKDAHRLARAFTLYFQLVNLAEENQRSYRILSHEADPDNPGPMTMARLFGELKKAKVSSDKMKKALAQLHVEPVLTAHPTEAKRKTTLNHLTRIRILFEELDQPGISWRKKARLEESILEKLEMLWQTKQVRDRSVKVENEIEYTLHFFRQAIFSAVSDLHDTFRRALDKYYPDLLFPVNGLSFGSWVGGDRDGNPMVLPETSRHALQKHREVVLDHYRHSLNRLFGLITSAKRFEKVDEKLEQSVAKDIRDFPKLKKKMTNGEPGEFYRMKLHGMWNRLDKARTKQSRGYRSPQEFIDDLRIIQRSLKSHHGHRTAEGSVQRLIDETQMYGFHLARLDFRQHMGKIRHAAKELIGRWPEPSEWPRLIKDPPLRFKVFSKLTKTVLSEFKTQKSLQEEFGPESTDHIIMSMCEKKDDIWAVLFLARKAGLLTKQGASDWKLHIDVSPLFETVKDLRNATNVMKDLWGNSFYRKLIRSRNNLQEVMLGYSDSNKSGGYLSANFELYRAEHALAKLAKSSGIQLRFFHGKGGSIDRGGGPAHRAVLAAPDSATDFQLRITEQGEVVSHKYSHPVIARRILEQMTTSVLAAGLHPQSLVQKNKVPETFQNTLEELADLSLMHYRNLVYENPRFETYFSQSSPIDVIQRIQIASRPVYRGGIRHLNDLRAIPWVFSWTQNRHLLSAWYGIGSGIESYLKKHGNKGRQLLKRMYKEWPYFSSLLDNAQTSLAKTDLMIARRYASLVEDEKIRKEIFGLIQKEYELSTTHVLNIVGENKFLTKMPVLLESVQLRNPYIDSLHALQVEYLKLWRHGRLPKKKKQEMLLVLLMTVNGIAFGMKSTG